MSKMKYKQEAPRNKWLDGMDLGYLDEMCDKVRDDMDSPTYMRLDRMLFAVGACRCWRAQREELEYHAPAAYGVDDAWTEAGRDVYVWLEKHVERSVVAEQFGRLPENVGNIASRIEAACNYIGGRISGMAPAEGRNE